MIDGASVPTIFFRIVVPIMRPSIISVAILQTMWIWNDYLLPYLTLDLSKYKTIPIAVQYLKGGYGSVDIWILGFEWVWAFQARFDNTVMWTLTNAYIVGIAHMGSTVVIVTIDPVYAGLNWNVDIFERGMTRVLISYVVFEILFSCFI